MTPFPHAAVGLVGWKYGSRRQSLGVLLIFLFVSCLPDIDFIIFELFGRHEIFIHQRYTHNLLFAVASALIFFPFLKEKRERIALIIIATSHLVMDVFVVDTVAPIGFRPFLPFSDVLLSFGFFPYVQRGTPAKVLSLRNVFAFALEVLVFVIPAVLLCRRELKNLLAKSRKGWRKERA